MMTGMVQWSELQTTGPDIKVEKVWETAWHSLGAGVYGNIEDANTDMFFSCQHAGNAKCLMRNSMLRPENSTFLLQPCVKESGACSSR